MKKRIQFLLAVFLLTATFSANAVTVDHTAGVFLTFRDCVAGETACHSLKEADVVIVEGLPGSREASAAFADESRGSSSAEVQVNDALDGSVQRARAASEPGRRNGSNTATLQKFTNDSDQAVSLSVSGALNFQRQAPAGDAGLGVGTSGASAEIGIVQMNFETLDVDNTAEANWKIMQDGPEGAEYTELGFATSGRDPDDPDSGTKEIAVTAVIGPGESAWIWTVLQALVANGAEASGEFEVRIHSGPVE